MLKHVLVVLMVFFLAEAAQAAEFWVSKTGSNANDCTAAQNSATPKLTVASALGCEGAGDTIWIGDGTYKESNIAALITSGSSATARTTLRAINRRQVTLEAFTSSSTVVEIQGKSHIAFIGIIFNGNGSTNSAIKINTAPSTGLWFEDIEATGSSAAQGLICVASSSMTVIKSRFHHNGSDSLDHGLYVSTGCDGSLIANNEMDNNANLGAQLYQFPVNVTFRDNYIHDNCQHPAAPGSGAEMIVANSTHIVENNTVVVGPRCGVGFNVKNSNPLNNTLRGNSIFCKSGSCLSGIGVDGAATGTILQNNTAIGFSNGINNLGTGTVLTDNLTSGTATNIWTDPANGNLTLKAGSVAIDGGTAIGLSFCGSNPDQGAFENPVVTAASINGNTLDVTICTTKPPIQALGGWTPACTGTGCGTPVASSISVTGGGLVRITVSGITGGNCAAGQTWTISTSGTTNQDSALVGNQFNQPLHTVTNFPVNSSACTGSGGSGAPPGSVANYNFESNLNDSSGNSNHMVGSANITYAASHDVLGVKFTNGVDSHANTGLLNGHNPSTTHLVVAFGVRIAAGDLGVRRFLGGVGIGTNQRFYIRRDSDNIWDMATQAGTSPVNTEFPVVAGDTHVCVKFNPTTDTATLYINGQAGTISGASVQSYTSYVFPSTFRFGLPSADFAVTQSPPDIIDQAYIYTTDVSCLDLYNAWNPSGGSAVSVTQATHRWQGVYTTIGGVAENRGIPDAQRTAVKGGAGSLMVQLNNTSGASVVVQPRFRYNINGGSFSNVVPDSSTADGVSYWGAASSNLNSGAADGPISGALAHTDGITLTSSAAIPTITMSNNTSYTLRGIFRLDATIGDVVCFKIYDQGGSALTSYTPTDGACLTVIAPQATP